MWLQLHWFFFWYSFISGGVAFQWNSPPVSPCWQYPELAPFLWLSGLGPLHPWLAESVSKAFARSFWNTGKVLSGSGKCADPCSSCYWTVRDKTLSSSGLWIPLLMGRVGRGCHGTAFLAGSKSHGWQVGKDPAVDHSTEMALREQSCTGQRHPQPCSEHILSQTFNLHCLSVKKKNNFSSLLHSCEKMSAFGDWIWF